MSGFHGRWRPFTGRYLFTRPLLTFLEMQSPFQIILDYTTPCCGFDRFESYPDFLRSVERSIIWSSGTPGAPCAVR